MVFINLSGLVFGGQVMGLTVVKPIYHHKVKVVL